jgi:hypothetical protein
VTGPQHYKEAETLLDRAQNLIYGSDREYGQAVLAEAQVHATLALAAATIDVGTQRRGMDWKRVT